MLQLFLFVFLMVPVHQPSPDAQLMELFEEYWEYSLQSNPLFATGQGDHRFNDKLPETGLDALVREYQKSLAFREKLEQIQREQLSKEDRINYDIFKLQLQNTIRSYQLNSHLLPLNGWWDYHATFADLPNRVPLRTIADYENYLSRLAAFEAYNSGYMERMRKGVEVGIVRPKIVFEDYPESISSLIKQNVDESLFYKPFLEYPERFSDEEKNRLQQEGERLIKEIINPQLEILYNFLMEEYIPASSGYAGITRIPGGEDYYDYLIEHYTTLSLSAGEVHQIGLAEVIRIRSEMMEIVNSEGYGDDFDGFVEYLRTDPRFYAETPEELMKETAYVLKRMDGKLPELFKTLPSASVWDY